MSTTVVEIDSPRRLEIESRSRVESSVFITAYAVSGKPSACIEIDRATFLTAVKAEFGLVDPLEIAYQIGDENDQR